MTHNPRIVRLPLILLALVLIIGYWRLLIGEAFFWGLPLLQFVPWRAYGLDAVRAGHWPLWNPYNGGGAPLMANYQSAFLYPLNGFGLFAPSYPVLGWLMSVTAVVHLWLSGFFMWLLAGRLGLQPLGQGVSLFAYALTSYTVARLGTYPIVSAVAWIPFVVWAVDGVMRQGRRRDVAWLALGVAMLLLAGHAQTAWYGLLLAGFFALWRVGYGWRRLLLALSAVILGAGVATLQLSATADLLSESARSDSYGTEEEAFRFSYAPLRMMNLVAPNSFGNPGNGSYLSSGIHYEYGVYVGMVTLIGAITALIGLRRLPREHGFWVAVLVVGFVLALGDSTPIFPFLYRHVPTFDMFQAPVRWHLWTVFAFSLLGGIGADAWWSGARVIFWTRLATAGAIGGALVVSTSRLYLSAELQALEGVTVLIDALVMTGVWVALAGILTLTLTDNVPDRFRPLPRGWGDAWIVAVWVVLALDLGVAMRGLNPTVTAEIYAPQSTTYYDDPAYRAYWPAHELDLVLFGQEIDPETGKVEFYELDELAERGITPYLYSRDYRIARDNWQTLLSLNLPNANLLSRAYLLNNNEPLLLAVYDDAHRAETLPRERVALTVRDGATVRITDDYNRVRIEIDNAAPISANVPMTLTLYDAPMRGWQAFVNGERVPILSPDDTDFGRKVEGLQAGANVVEMVYRPSWLPWGGAVSVVSLLVLIGLFSPITTRPSKSPKSP